MTTNRERHLAEERERGSLQERVGWEAWCPEEQIAVDGMVWSTKAEAQRAAKAHNAMFNPRHEASWSRVIIKPHPV